jgi:sugar lactone lactonase YvrE
MLLLPGTAMSQSGSQVKPIIVRGGLMAPESALHDPQADIYLVSNVNGAAGAKDDNGFISRVTPDGKVSELKWIDGAAPDVTLNAPKGMAFKGDILLVADIDNVRLFDRNTGKARGAWSVPHAEFLNDVMVTNDGTVYATDTAISLKGGTAMPDGTPEIYRFDANGQATVVAKGAELDGPNGIVDTPQGPAFATFQANEIKQLSTSGGVAHVDTVATLPKGQLDGLVRLADGSFLVSSWAERAVFHVRPGDKTEVVVSGANSPAGIGFDTKRQQVLVPQLMENQLQIVKMRDARG